jgi:hypothetical protein
VSRRLWSALEHAGQRDALQYIHRDATITSLRS